MLINDLSKIYNGRCGLSAGTLAVDGLTCAVPAGDCLGLLGINGSGKTTTFEMLTGKLIITAGTAYIKGQDIATDIVQVCFERCHLIRCRRCTNVYIDGDNRTDSSMYAGETDERR